MFTGNYRDSTGKSECREFKSMGITYYIPAIPVILKSPHSDFYHNICREYDFTGILHAKFARGGSNGVPAVGLLLSLDAVKIFFKTD